MGCKARDTNQRWETKRRTWNEEHHQSHGEENCESFSCTEEEGQQNENAKSKNSSNNGFP